MVCLRDFSKEEMINKERIRRLVNWYYGKNEGPIHIDAELHKRCNLSCRFCPRSASDYDLNLESKTKELPVERWIGIVEEAADLGVMVFNLEGANEPIFVPELAFPVIEKIKDLEMYGIITTNGTLWDEEKIEKLVKIGWDRIHFSIDAPDAETHDYLRGMDGAFDKAIKNIRILNKYKEREGSDFPMLNMNIMICNKNFRKLPDMVELANKLNVDYIFVEPLMIFSEIGRELKINNNHVENTLPEYIRTAKNLAEKYFIDNNFSTQDKNLDEDLVTEVDKKKVLISDVKRFSNDGLLSSPCFKPWSRIAIKYDGLIGHCGLIQDGENIMEKSLKEFWYGQWLNDIRKKMKNGQLLKHCSNCIPSDITQRRRFRKKIIESLRSDKIDSKQI